MLVDDIDDINPECSCTKVKKKEMTMATNPLGTAWRTKAQKGKGPHAEGG